MDNPCSVCGRPMFVSEVIGNKINLFCPTCDYRRVLRRPKKSYFESQKIAVIKYNDAPGLHNRILNKSSGCQKTATNGIKGAVRAEGQR